MLYRTDVRKMITEKEDLQNRLKEIERKEVIDTAEKQKQENHKRFKNRINDWVIGKAHADIGLHKGYDGKWQESKQTIGQTISIHGNVGKSYSSQAQVTDATYTYFHNLWTNNQRYQFQQKLNKVALDEIKKIVNTLPQILEFIHLTSDYTLKTIYPEDKIDEIKAEVWKETCKILDKYSDKDFLDLIVLKRGWIDIETEEPILPFYDFACRNRNILFRYIAEKRKKLIPKFKKVSSFEEYLEKKDKNE